MKKECSKNNKNYKRQALLGLCKALDALEMNKYEEMKTILFEVIENDEMDEDEDEEKRKRENEKYELIAVSFECLAYIWIANSGIGMSIKTYFRIKSHN
jgi:hypothetical protein